MDEPLTSDAVRRQQKKHPRRKFNKLRAWLMQDPRPMTVHQFAARVGCTASYVSQLTSDNPPWPSKDIAIRIAFLTGGEVTPNDLAGYVKPAAPDPREAVA